MLLCVLLWLFHDLWKINQWIIVKCNYLLIFLSALSTHLNNSALATVVVAPKRGLCHCLWHIEKSQLERQWLPSVTLPFCQWKAGFCCRTLAGTWMFHSILWRCLRCDVVVDFHYRQAKTKQSKPSLSWQKQKMMTNWQTFWLLLLDCGHYLVQSGCRPSRQYAAVGLQTERSIAVKGSASVSCTIWLSVYMLRCVHACMCVSLFACFCAWSFSYHDECNVRSWLSLD